MERKDDAQPSRTAYEGFSAFPGSKEGKDFARVVHELDEAIDRTDPGGRAAGTRRTREPARPKQAGIGNGPEESAAEKPVRKRQAPKAKEPDRNGPQQAAESQTAPAGEQQPESGREYNVFDRVAELEAKVAELEAKEARRRERVNARSRAWRQKNLDKAREQTRERVRVSRARKRQRDS